MYIINSKTIQILTTTLIPLIFKYIMLFQLIITLAVFFKQTKLTINYDIKIYIYNIQTMYTLLKQLYQNYCGSPEYNIALFGIEKTGKTQILKSLKNKEAPYSVGVKQEYKATIGLNTTFFSFETTKFLIWDLGGKQSIRKIWDNYYPYTHGFIYIFDERLDQGLLCLKNILNNGEMISIPCLILIRNSQIKKSIEESLIEEGLQINHQRSTKIDLIPLSRERLYEQLEWLYEEIKKLDANVR